MKLVVVLPKPSPSHTFAGRIYGSYEAETQRVCAVRQALTLY